MAAGSFTVYSNAALNISEGKMNLSSDTFVMVLVGSGYTPAPNTDSTWANVSANEITTGSGYTQGGVVLAGLSDTLSTATVTWTCTAPSWSNFSATFKYAVIVRRAGASLASTDLLVCYCDCNTTSGTSTVTGGGGTLTITPNASGIFTVTHSP
jgi:hypothetical protein